MPRKTPENHRHPWTSAQDQKLEKLAEQNTPTRVIALKLERTESAIRQRAGELDASLRPTNQSPYTRRRRT